MGPVSGLAHRVTRRLLAPLAGLALAGALAAGCAPAPGTAATVDGRVIGESEVASVVDEISIAGTMTPTQAVANLIVAPVLLDVAAEAGYGVSDEDAVAALDRIAADQGVDPVQASDATLLVVRSLIATSGLQGDEDAAALSAALSERLDALDVQVSARYGDWDGQGITPVQVSWIEQPAAE